MNLILDRSIHTPLYRQIATGIRQQILAGVLPGGYRLPPERDLARTLGVNRSTVLNAYDELKADGLLEARVGRGTIVQPAMAPVPPGEILPPRWDLLARDTPQASRDPLLRDLLALTERQDIISLSVGVPAPELLPCSTLRQLQDGILTRHGAEALSHSPTEGASVFRESLSGLMASRGVRCPASEILVTSGSQQAVYLLARIYLEPGDTIIVEEPAYFVALGIFRATGARVSGIPADRDGMRTDLLEALLERYRPKLIYTLPTFQNPSGSVLSLSRRQKLLELAWRFRIPVLEDDLYCDLRYEGDPLPSLKAMDPYGFVIYISSFSKVLFPGFRLGWTAAPRPVLRQMALAKQNIDLHSNTFGQWVLHRFLEEGHYRHHLELSRPCYARRRDVMLESLEQEALPGVSWNHPAGGFYLWLKLPENLSQSQLLAAAGREGVAFLPGAPFFASDPPANCIRLNFSLPGPEQVREGIRRLARAIRSLLPDPSRRAVPGQGTPPLV